MTNPQVKDLEFKVIENVPSWAVFNPEIAKEDGLEYYRKMGSEIIYKQTHDGFQCMSCDSEIQTAQVAHTIRDNLFLFSGSGKCKYEEVLYCPKCEKKPNYCGLPITVEK